jgi:steroid delta-isomerase-like uncharacterized protein
VSGEPRSDAAAVVARLVDRFYDELWNRFDETMVSVLLHDDVRFRGSLGRDAQGHREFVEYMRMVHAAFPDFRNVVEEVVVEGDRAFARLAYSGTHRGAVLGVEPTGRRVQYAGAALFRVRDGRIASLWVLGDMYGLARQLRDDLPG